MTQSVSHLNRSSVVGAREAGDEGKKRRKAHLAFPKDRESGGLKLICPAEKLPIASRNFLWLEIRICNMKADSETSVCGCFRQNDALV